MYTVKDLRAKAGLSLRDVATALGVRHTYIHDIETGKSPPSKRLLKGLAHALGVDECDVRDACPPAIIRISDLTLEQRHRVLAYVATVRKERA